MCFVLVTKEIKKRSTPDFHPKHLPCGHIGIAKKAVSWMDVRYLFLWEHEFEVWMLISLFEQELEDIVGERKIRSPSHTHQYLRETIDDWTFFEWYFILEILNLITVFFKIERYFIERQPISVIENDKIHVNLTKSVNSDE